MFGGGIGMQELMVILVIALLIIGPKKLPDIGKGLGGAIRDFRKSVRGSDDSDDISSDSHEKLKDTKGM
jgi:TatA/E family protein of Tat protein translocase